MRNQLRTIVLPGSLSALGDPEALAGALVKLEQGAALLPAEATPATASLFIVNPFGGVEAVSRWFSTHPSTRERVERLLAVARARPAWDPRERRGPPLVRGA